eukprot:gnl/TRDRNA2_/TRDRNA2_184321_c0_seq1.p1 gnl/TRDRNA2_/TRDRNA2_184321_c0~~gnl/TRDRNA2_/TRDRNA2_184321_c0_seq1.p1  ORF type:complete len:226 (+),score=48.76 gnl/TRDRNA2_/TRDRNA2_184321_c0_seq1:80-757(+)
MAKAPLQMEMEGHSFEYGESMEIVQVFTFAEMCGIEAKNSYVIDEGRMFIREESACLERICCSTNRSLTFIAHAGPDKMAPEVLHMHKPFGIPCLCLCRPEFEVTLPSGTPVGKVEDPFACCTMNQHIYNDQGELVFNVDGSICQCGLCCKLCADVEFSVTDPHSGEEIGHITKPKVTCMEMCKKINRFQVQFPEGCSEHDKALLVASAMLLDLAYFEENQNDDN